jgi:hypothetical protein
VKQHIPYFSILTEVESIVSRMHPFKQNEIRIRTNNILNNYVAHPEKLKPLEKHIMELYKETRKFMNENDKEIVITTADKGGKTVVMYREDYMTKMTSLVSDTNTYENLTRDPTQKIQRELNACLKAIFDKKHIDWYTYNNLTSHNSVSPKIYGVPKIHKPAVPLRPIVSFVQSPTYNVSGYMARILRKLKDIEKYNIKNSFELKDELMKEKVPPGFSLVSFDVVSLFTSIDVRLATHEIMEKWPEIEEITPIEKDDFRKLLNICTDAGYFSHEDRIYKQVYGTPMGSPLSPVLADIVMDKVLDHVMERKGESINYICKYVDDILAIVKTSEIQNILDVFHSYNQSLKFTYEIENEGRIPYLEVQIIKTDNGSIDLDWYQKPTSTNRILNFLSNHPNHQKLNTAENLLRRATTLCSKQFRNKNLKLAKNILENNNYPKQTINKLIMRVNKTRKKQTNPDNQQNNQTQQNMTYRSLTYVKNVSDRIVLAVRQADDSIKIALKANRNYKSMKSITKDQPPLLDKTNLVYRIPCTGCDLTYVGHTSQYLKKRISQHEKCTQRTAVFIHKEETHHTLDFGAVEILQHEQQKTKREFLEMLHINNNNTMNIKTDVAGISNTYKPFLRTLKNKKLV